MQFVKGRTRHVNSSAHLFQVREKKKTTVASFAFSFSRNEQTSCACIYFRNWFRSAERGRGVSRLTFHLFLAKARSRQ